MQTSNSAISTALKTQLPACCWKAQQSLQVNLYLWPPFTYLGKVVFVLTLLEGIAVEICRLIGQLGDDSVFHLICWFNSSR